MAEPTERDRTLARLAFTALDWIPLERALLKLSAQARQEGRQEALRQAEAACDDIAAEHESIHASLCAKAMARLQVV